MSGRLGDLSAKQADALQSMKTNLSDVLQPRHNDHVLLRFLRARKFSVKKAEEMFRQDLIWRSQNRVDTILEWFQMPEVCLKYWPGGAVGLDKEGHIVWISPLGNVDPKGMLYSVKAGDVIKTNIHILERLTKEQEAVSRKLRRNIEGITMIIDLEHLGTSHMWKPGMNVMTEIACLFEQHYPEVIHRVFIVRPTKIFPAVYIVLKPFLSEGTREKIKVIGGSWKDVLLKYIDADVLPVHWGGTVTDAGGNPNMCPSRINLGGKVPTFYYRKGRSLEHAEMMTTQELPGKKSVEIKFKANRFGSIFRYEFKTESHDVAFGITRTTHTGEKVVILDEKRYNSHIVAEDGEIWFEEPGLYIVKFDNHGAFQKTRKLSYWMEVIEPPPDNESMLGASCMDDIVRDSGYHDGHFLARGRCPSSSNHSRESPSSSANLPGSATPSRRNQHFL
ncbi:SEC14-like protein 2 [Diadema antillarum]|uniref:SEC14-like protein 2 n=1 Tax=Diadema antillarum TaxID=105358 RepID=UPI003A8A5987